MRVKTPIRCFLLGHRPLDGRVGPCQRKGCDHVTMTWTNGRIWVKYTTPPTVNMRPEGLPKKR